MKDEENIRKILFVPRSYYIDKCGIRVYYGFKKMQFLNLAINL